MDYILYLRAFTLRQGQSGLGLEGQRLIAHRFLQSGERIVAEYIEVESGRKNARPEMARATDGVLIPKGRFYTLSPLAERVAREQARKGRF